MFVEIDRERDAGFIMTMRLRWDGNDVIHGLTIKLLYIVHFLFLSCLLI